MLSQERQPGLRQRAKTCREKQLLIQAYKAETGALARSVEALAADPSRDGYGDVWRLAGEVHLRSQQARLALERHAPNTDVRRNLRWQLCPRSSRLAAAREGAAGYYGATGSHDNKTHGCQR